jgi:glycosyltransferase involved in cell wall biosynthesis
MNISTSRTTRAVPIDYSLILPAHNERKRIGSTLEKYCAEWDAKLQASGKTYELVVVANGCCDGTVRTVEEFSSKQPSHRNIRLLRLSEANKGYAVLVGFRHACGRIVGFADADGAVAPSLMLDIMKKAEQNVVVIGSKYHHQAQCQQRQPVFRRLASRCWRSLIALLLRLQVTDTQAGAKAMPAACVQVILDRVVPCHFAFDVSLLWEAKKAGYEIAEIPLVWKHLPGSKFSLLREAPRMFLALVQLRFALKRVQRRSAVKVGE